MRSWMWPIVALARGRQDGAGVDLGAARLGPGLHQAGEGDRACRAAAAPNRAATCSSRCASIRRSRTPGSARGDGAWPPGTRPCSAAVSERALNSSGSSAGFFAQPGISPQRTSSARRSGRLEPRSRRGPADRPAGSAASARCCSAAENPRDRRAPNSASTSSGVAVSANRPHMLFRPGSDQALRHLCGGWVATRQIALARNRHCLSGDRPARRDNERAILRPLPPRRVGRHLSRRRVPAGQARARAVEGALCLPGRPRASRRTGRGSGAARARRGNRPGGGDAAAAAANCICPGRGGPSGFPPAGVPRLSARAARCWPATMPTRSAGSASTRCRRCRSSPPSSRPRGDRRGRARAGARI